jgi:hypothetical protein
MNGVAFDFVVDDFARNGGGRRAFDLFDEARADRTRAHIAAGRAFSGKILAVVNVYLDVEAERAGAPQKLYGEERAGGPGADNADSITRLKIGRLRHPERALASPMIDGGEI